LLGSALGWMALRLGRAIPALMMAWQMGGRADARFRHLVYLMETAYVASRCKALKINYTHAHFGTNSASVAALVGALGGPGFSFTTRGPEKFDAPLSLSLGEKVAASHFTVAISSFGRSQLCRWSDPAKWHKIKVVHWGD
jgi:colanic acid/amylovoran biosynthesis glycosyltransferase